MRTRVLLMAVSSALAMFPCVLAADPFDDLAREFWQWRAGQQPAGQDDMPRIDRPAEWTPEWSKDSVPVSASNSRPLNSAGEVSTRVAGPCRARWITGCWDRR